MLDAKLDQVIKRIRPSLLPVPETTPLEWKTRSDVNEEFDADKNLEAATQIVRAMDQLLRSFRLAARGTAVSEPAFFRLMYDFDSSLNRFAATRYWLVGDELPEFAPFSDVFRIARSLRRAIQDAVLDFLVSDSNANQEGWTSLWVEYKQRFDDAVGPNLMDLTDGIAGIDVVDGEFQHFGHLSSSTKYVHHLWHVEAYPVVVSRAVELDDSGLRRACQQLKSWVEKEGGHGDHGKQSESGKGKRENSLADIEYDSRSSTWTWGEHEFPPFSPRGQRAVAALHQSSLKGEGLTSAELLRKSGSDGDAVRDLFKDKKWKKQGEDAMHPAWGKMIVWSGNDRSRTYHLAPPDRNKPKNHKAPKFPQG